MLPTLIFFAIWIGSIALAVNVGRPRGMQKMGFVLALLMGPIGLAFTWLAAHDNGIRVRND